MISNNISEVMNRISSIQKEFSDISNKYLSLFGKKNNQTVTESNNTRRGESFRAHLNNAINNSNSNIYLNQNSQDINNISNRASIPITNTANQLYNYSDIINEAGQKYGLSPALIRAVIKVESDFNTRAISRAGAKGLMQLMPVNIKNLNVKNPFDPKENIMAGTRFLRELYEQFDYNIEKALAAYNAGPNRVRIEGIPQNIKINYVDKVLENFKKFGGF